MTDSIAEPTDSLLPTEPGWYLGQRGLVFLLKEDGAWWSPSMSERPDAIDLQFWSPLVRLIPETELAHTDSIKILLERALDALRRRDEPEIEFLIAAGDAPEILGGTA